MDAVEFARPVLRRRAAEAALRHRAPLSVERPRRFRGVAGEGRFPPRRPQRVDRGERADRTGCVREESVQPIWHIERAVCVCRVRSEEHTSELQSLMRNSYAVFCLKKKKKTD